MASRSAWSRTTASSSAHPAAAMNAARTRRRRASSTSGTGPSCRTSRQGRTGPSIPAARRPGTVASPLVTCRVPGSIVVERGGIGGHGYGPTPHPRRQEEDGRNVSDVEAHITGTVWKIEVEVGDSVDEGDTVVILESMKMEMPVEAEDDGHRQGDPLRGGPVGLRGRHARRPRVVADVELAGGKLLLDEPAAHVARLTISNPAKRDALDHAILDAIAEHRAATLDARCVIVTGDGPDVLGRLRHRRPPRRRASPSEAEKLVAHPFARRDRRARGATRTRRRRAQRPRDRRRARARAVLRPADRGATAIKLGMPPAKLGLVYSHTGLRKFIDTIGVAAHARAVPRRAQHRRRRAPELGPGQRRRRRRRARGRGARRSPPRSPATRRCRCAATSA